MVLFPRSLRHSVLSVAKPFLYRFREAPHAGLSKFTSSLSQQDSLPTFPNGSSLLFPQTSG